jgi:tRNA A-37 threonylcarbamoyl transferase component Bud32
MSSPVAIGSVVAGFRLDSLLGQGAMGAVYLAEDTESAGRKVALKLLAPELAEDERFRHRFLRESQLAASLDHPHMVPILGSGDENGVLYLAMEYIPGSDLRELLRRDGPLEPGRALRFVGQVADALDAAHAAGLVHRDVKPGNILVAENDHTYVCDFGLARHVTSVSSLTGDRGFVGTIDYVPPEQIKGGDIDSRADVYALGCVLYECLAGTRPFERDSELAVVYAHLNEPPPRLSDARHDLPEAFDDVFQIALAKSPAARYSTCQQLTKAASAAMLGKTLARRTRPLRRFLLAGVVLLVAVGAAIGSVLLTQGSERPPTISQAALGGARLGTLAGKSPSAWGQPGAIIPLKYPDQYAKQTFDARKVAVYYDSGITEAIQDGLVGAVEFTTWNKDDRTEAGVGPCSTLDELRAAYGPRLKVVEANIIDGKPTGFTVGQHLFFAVDERTDPPRVSAVAVYSNSLQFAGFNALGDGPCS